MLPRKALQGLDYFFAVRAATSRNGGTKRGTKEKACRDMREKALFSLVAGERYRLSPHQPNLRYLIQSFA
jgi:hypothetical protein